MENGQDGMKNGNQRAFDANPYIQNNGNEMNNQAQQNPYYNDSQVLRQQNPNVPNSILGTFDTENFIKGALLGALGAYLLTNENAQKTIFKTVAKGTEVFQAGMEEMKERFEDAKAEMEAAKEEN